MSSSPRRKKKGANDMNLWLTKEGMPTVLKHIKRQSTSVREMQIKTTLKSIFAVRLAWISSWSRLKGSKSYSYPTTGEEIKVACALWRDAESRAWALYGVSDIKCERRVEDYSRFLAKEFVVWVGYIAGVDSGVKNQECNWIH